MVKQILQIHTSIRDKDDSYSSRAAELAVNELLKKCPEAKVVTLDLDQNPLPPLDAEFDAAAHTQAELRNQEQQKILQKADMTPLVESDIYVIGLAGYMYDMPASFKNFLEHAVQYDITVNPDFSPRLSGKKVIIVTAWGGDNDSIEPEIGYEYVLKKAFGVLGIHDVKIFNIYRTDDITVTEDEVDEAIAKYIAEMN